MKRPRLWLLLSTLRQPENAFVIPTVAWIAKEAGASFEVYLESERQGVLFAETGSTVLGGHHHHQFNYLCAVFDIGIIRFGPTSVFDSSVSAFGLPIIAEADHPAALYESLLGVVGEQTPECVVVGPGSGVEVGTKSINLAPYLFPEILYRRALGASPQSAPAVLGLASKLGCESTYSVFLDREEIASVRSQASPLEIVDQVRDEDTWGSLTLRIARRWQNSARGLVFGDPPAVLSQLASHCRHRRVAVYQPRDIVEPVKVKVSAYVESLSPIAAEAASLAVALGNRTIVGRQTGDGDIFEWSKQGVSIQIIDPNRPAFPIVEEVDHPWQRADQDPSVEPTDNQLREWADHGKVLTTLVWHSGEVAHNEAMIALIELASWSGLKMGLGVHLPRYKTCPQMWELLSVPRENGGARGLVEPLLHSGGLGVLAECHCPPELLAENCREALEGIRRIAGPAAAPHGYYAFMDSNLDRLDHIRADLFSAISSCGFEYIISSALPGRNRVLWCSEDRRTLAINQTPRVVHAASPFVRATTAADLHTTQGASGPGWIVATLDAPVVAFSPYIWRHGNRLMELVHELNSRNRINVTPRTVARYAQLLARLKILPDPPVAAGEPTATRANVSDD